MNRFTAKLVHGFARLAFWRKPVAPPSEQPETPAAEALMDLQPVEAEAGAAADTPEPQVGKFVRLKQLLNWARKHDMEQPVDPDQTTVMEAPTREQPDAGATADEAPVSKRSLLARVKNTLRRQPGPETLGADADESIPSAGQNMDAAVSSEAGPASDEDTVQVGRFRRVLATLSNKWVWIPGASVMLLALIGAMALLLLQSEQEKQQLQAELLATQKKLEQTGVSKKAAADADAPRPAGDPVFVAVGSAAADTRPGVDAGDCQVSDKESVTQNLKNCIDSFNRSMAGSRPAGTAP